MMETVMMTIFGGRYHNPPTLKLMHTLSISIMVAKKVPLKEKILQVSGFIDLATRIHTESFLPYLTGQVPFLKKPFASIFFIVTFYLHSEKIEAKARRPHICKYIKVSFTSDF